jgi:hypothetical protein
MDRATVDNRQRSIQYWRYMEKMRAVPEPVFIVQAGSVPLLQGWTFLTIYGRRIIPSDSEKTLFLMFPVISRFLPLFRHSA